MESKIVVNSYMITNFIKFYNDETLLGVIDIVNKFAINPYYNSRTPIMRRGLSDIFIPSDRKYDYEYDCDICDDLLKYDRYSIQGRIAFYELMRILLPSYSIVLESDEEIEVQAFLSVYNNGFCGITHVYNKIDMPLSKSTSNFMEYNDDMKYIKLDRLLVDILRITPTDVTDDNFIGVGINREDFMSITEGNPFNLHIELIAKILAINCEDDKGNISESEISYTLLKDFFRVYNLLADNILDDEDIERIRIDIEELDELHHFNYNVYTELLDLSVDKNESIFLSYKYLLFIKQADYKAKNRRFISMYALTELFLNERCKLYEAQRELKELNYNNSKSIEDLINFRNKYLDIIKLNLGYELFRPEEAQSAEHIKDVLRINYIHSEITTLFEKYFQISRLDKEVEEKRKQIKEQEKDRRFNKLIQIVTLILAIPAITQIIDILYIVEIKKIIFFPIGLAKLIWVILISILILVFFYKINNKK